MTVIKIFTNIKRHQGAVKYLKNTSWLFGEKVLRLSVGLFVGVWVARYLGPERFGLFSYAQSLVAVFATVATLGLDSIVIRELVRDEKKKDKLLGTAFLLKLIGAILVLLLLAIVMYAQSSDFETIIIVYLIALTTVFQSFNVIDLYFQSKVLSKFVVFSNLLNLLLSSIIKMVLIYNEAPLITFAFVVLFDSFTLMSGFIFFYFQNKMSVFTWHFDKNLAKSLLKDSWPLILSGLVISVYMKIDQIMIKNMLGDAAVGQYVAAVRLSEAWYFIPAVIISSLFPAIINIHSKSKKLYYSRLQNLYDLMVWMAVAIALPITFMSDYLIDFLYGDAYKQAGGVLVIHIWAGVFVFIGFVFSKHLAVKNLTKKAFYRTLLGAVINILLNYILISRYGINGAAIATLLGQLVANYLYDLFDKDLHIQFKMKTKSFLPIHLLTRSR